MVLGPVAAAPDYTDRVLVTVNVQRVLTWPDLTCTGERSTVGNPAPTHEPGPQAPPKAGIAPRVDAARAATRLRRLPHVLAAYAGADGFPAITPVTIGAAGPSGISVSSPLPPGGRRAGLLGHRYGPKLIGLETRQHTGWLEDGVYAPHTEHGFRAPANKTLLLLGNGYMARQGLKQARALGRS